LVSCFNKKKSTIELKISETIRKKVSGVKLKFKENLKDFSKIY
jgi:hypothetical protein